MCLEPVAGVLGMEPLSFLPPYILDNAVTPTGPFLATFLSAAERMNHQFA